MLESLHLKNFIIVKEMTINFDEGLSVITGETGAGKSLIMKSLGLLLGQQSNDDYIYPEEDVAFIEAIFKLPTHLSFNEYDVQDGLLIVSRRIQRNRSTVNKINGETVPLKQLKTVLNSLLFLTAQHQVYELMNVTNHMGFFDQYIGDKLNLLRGRYQTEYRCLTDLKKRLKQLTDDFRDTVQETNDLEILISDIDSKQFSVDEEEKLVRQQKQIQSLKTQRGIVNTIISKTTQMIDVSVMIEEDLLALNQYDEGVSPFDLMPSIELFRDIQQVASKQLLDIEYLESVDSNDFNERLDEIFKYRLKYKVNTLSELLQLRDDAIKKKQYLVSSTQTVNQLEKDIVLKEAQVLSLAKQLSKLRKSFTKGFDFMVTDQLNQLGMSDAEFSVQITELSECNIDGCDFVEFLFSANSNMPLKPLKGIASGGELSRVLLALLVSNRYIITQPVLVFDEIDVGIGGVTGNYIGNVIANLAKKTQLIVVTHLPQIARCANHHFKITKNVQNDGVCVNIKKIKEGEVSTELQRMVGGNVVTSLIR